MINPFTKLDFILEDHLENEAKNAKMASWKIQNDILARLVVFIRKRIKEEILELRTFGVMLLLCNLPKWSSYNTQGIIDSLYISDCPTG